MDYINEIVVIKRYCYMGYLSVKLKGLWLSCYLLEIKYFKMLKYVKMIVNIFFNCG